MNNLDEARIKINEIDKELIDLFKRRMELSKEIGLYKFENNLPILDEKREELLRFANVIPENITVSAITQIIFLMANLRFFFSLYHK